MAKTDSSEYALPPYDAKFSWKAAVFAALACGRYYGVAHAKAVISIDISKGFFSKMEFVGHLIATISGLYLICSGGYIFGHIIRRAHYDMPYDTRLNWRMATFAVLFYGRCFGGADTKNMIDQCISQEDDDGKCGAHVFNIVLALYLSCSAGFFFAFLIAPFARDQAVKLSRTTVACVVILYVTAYSGDFDGVKEVIIECISKDGDSGKCGGRAVETVSALLLTYFVPLIVGNTLNILTIISKILTVAASRLEAIVTNIRAASRNEKQPDETIAYYQVAASTRTFVVRMAIACYLAYMFR